MLELFFADSGLFIAHLFQILSHSFCTDREKCDQLQSRDTKVDIKVNVVRTDTLLTWFFVQGDESGEDLVAFLLLARVERKLM